MWADDVALMREAGVTLVSLGIFSWGELEPAEGVFDFGWLDRILDLLHEAGIGVDLATPSAAPPVWLHLAHPEMLPVDADGLRFTHGSRESWCVSSPVIRHHATRIARVVAERYGHHPAVKMWHVSNELACHNGRCYCDVSAAAFRDWLGKEYADVDALNLAWGTAFWGQRYASFDQILPPRRTTTIPNPGQRLDFERFSSDAFVAHLEAEAAVLREVTPHLPVTTNYMVMGDFHQIDYTQTTPLVDIVSNDHYLWAEDPRGWAELAFSADRVRGLAGGDPWVLMEHSTSAVNWQPRNLAKGPGQMLRNALQHVARGADGVLFFQWRQSRAGAEKYHSGMVPHAGADSALFREVVHLGTTLGPAGRGAGERRRAGPGRPALGHAGLVGGRPRGAPDRRPALPGPGPTPARRAAGRRGRGRRAARRVRPRRLRRGPGADALPGTDRPVRPAVRRRRARRSGARLLLLGHRRRPRPRDPRRLPGGVPGPARGPRRGVRTARRARVGGAQRRVDR